MRGQMMNSREM